MTKGRFGLLASLLLLMVVFALPASAQFGTIQRGPLLGVQCPGGQPQLGIDSVNTDLYFCGNGGTYVGNVEPLSVQPAVTAVTSVTTAQTMASYVMNAGLQNVVGRDFLICGAGVYTSPGATTPTITIQLIEGGITPVAITSSAISSTASTNLPFNFCFNVLTVSTGATGTLESHGWLNINLSANTPAAAITSFLDTNTAVSSSINLGAANTLAVQVAASLTVTSVTLRTLTIVQIQ